MAGYMHLAAYDLKCQLKRAPQINITASDTAVKYDTSKSQAELDNFQYDTVSPYGQNVQTHVGGLMSGSVSISQNIRIMQETYAALNQGCLYIDSINVKIHIDPTIYIANHYKRTGCMFNAIMEHEQKHIKVDRMIVNKYSALIGKSLYAALKPANYTYGPFQMSQMPLAQENIQASVQSILKTYSEQMSAERQAKQQAVDSLQEYERVRKLCLGKD